MADMNNNTATPGRQSAAILAQLLANPEAMAVAARRVAIALTAAAIALDAEAAKPAEHRAPLLAAAIGAYAGAMRAHQAATCPATPVEHAGKVRRSPAAHEIERATPGELDPVFVKIRPLIRDLGVVWARTTLDRHGVKEWRELNSAQLAAVRVEAEDALAVQAEAENG